MKRYISLTLAAVVLVVSLAVPCYAADFDNISYIDLFDYYTFDRLSVSAQTPTIFTFDLPIDAYYYYVDIILISNNGLSSVDITWNNNDYPLTIVPLGNEMYRVFGSTRLALDYISLRFVCPYSAIIYIKSFDIFYQEITNFDAPIEAIGGSGPDVDFDLSLNYGDTRPTYIQYTVPWEYTTYNLSITSYDWVRYDFLDIVLYMNVSNINSISANYGGIDIPVDVSYLPSSDGIDPTYILSLRMDFRGLDKSGSDPPVLRITGISNVDSLNYISLWNAQGIVFLDSVKPLPYFFNNLFSNLSNWFGNVGTWISNQTTTITSSITSWFGSLHTWINDQTSSLTSSLSDFFSTWFNLAAYWIREQTSSLSSTISTWGQKIVDALTPDTDAADSVVDKTQQQAEQMDDNNNALQQLQRPDINTGVSSGDISGIVSPSNTIKYTLFLSRIMQAPILSEVIMLSMIFSLAAYVLFGKR